MAVGCRAGLATAMYAPTYQRQRPPPAAPIIKSLRRPTVSIKKKRYRSVKTVLTTPNKPVVKSPVFVPTIPILLNTVGE